MRSGLKKKIMGVLSAGAIAIASVLIQDLEGVKYEPYYDVAGVLTICYGHTGKDIMLGKTYTEAECQALLNKDLRKVAKQIDPYIEVQIPDTMRAALYSFAYNVGSYNFKTSTLLHLLNQGKYNAACNQLHRWIYADGKPWKGLMNRRQVEYEVCVWSQK